MGGEYRFSVYSKWSIGLNISYTYGQLIITIPFIDIHLSFSKHAEGILLFGKEFFGREF